MNKKIKPPFKPKLNGDSDVTYIDDMFKDQQIGETPESYFGASLENSNEWKDFTYTGGSKLAS